MLPTDAAMDHGARCNAIQNALQKINIHISFEQAAIVLVEISRDFNAFMRLRRKENKESGKTVMQQSKAGSEDSTQICPACNGRGGGYNLALATPMACSKCNGTGKLLPC
jgi:DnaJ-class molecular chaperone